MNFSSRTVAKLVATAALMYSFAAAQTQTQPARQTGGTAATPHHATPSVLIYVELTKTVDSKKAKTGDPIEAKTLQEIKAPDGTSIPRGSRVVGHVTRASAHTKEQPQAQLGMVFEKIVMKSGQEFPLNGVLEAVSAPESAPQNPGGGLGQGSAGGQQQGGESGLGQQPGMSGQAGSQAAGRPGAAETGGAQGARAGTDVNSIGAAPTYAASSVTGLKDVELAPGPEPALRSNLHNIHLDSGSMITVRVFAARLPQ